MAREIDQPTLGMELRLGRETHGLSQRQLARLADVASSQINRWESDEVIPTPRFLIRLAHILELRAAKLFELAGIPMPEEQASLPAMLRAEYELPPEAIADIQRYITKVAKQYRA